MITIPQAVVHCNLLPLLWMCSLLDCWSCCGQNVCIHMVKSSNFRKQDLGNCLDLHHMCGDLQHVQQEIREIACPFCHVRTRLKVPTMKSEPLDTFDSAGILTWDSHEQSASRAMSSKSVVQALPNVWYFDKAQTDCRLLRDLALVTVTNSHCRHQEEKARIRERRGKKQKGGESDRWEEFAFWGVQHSVTGLHHLEHTKTLMSKI